MRAAASRERNRQEQHAGDDDCAQPCEQRVDGAQAQLGRERRNRRQRDQIVVVIDVLGVDLELVVVVEGIVDPWVAAGRRPTAEPRYVARLGSA